jgi:hypothetical protein
MTRACMCKLDTRSFCSVDGRHARRVRCCRVSRSEGRRGSSPRATPPAAGAISPACPAPSEPRCRGAAGRRASRGSLRHPPPNGDASGGAACCLTSAAPAGRLAVRRAAAGGRRGTLHPRTPRRRRQCAQRARRRRRACRAARLAARPARGRQQSGGRLGGPRVQVAPSVIPRRPVTGIDSRRRRRRPRPPPPGAGRANPPATARRPCPDVTWTRRGRAAVAHPARAPVRRPSPVTRRRPAAGRLPPPAASRRRPRHRPGVGARRSDRPPSPKSRRAP